MNLKNFLRWLIRGWLPEEPKTRKNLLKERARLPIAIVISAATIAIISLSLQSLSAPTQPTSPASVPPPPPPELPTAESHYYPGVSVGDYVTYGNFVCNFSHPAGPEWDLYVCLCAMDWQKMEVIGVSGKEVVLRYTEQLKNGSASDHNGCVHVIEDIEHPSWINGSCKYQGYYFGSTVVAANLTEGNWLHSSGPCGMPWHLVNKTEIRTYLGTSRWVNILRNPNFPSLTNWIFDVESGVLLEYENIGPNNMRTSYSVVETNIFSSPSPSPTSPSLQETTAQTIPTDAFYATSGLLVMAIFAVTMRISRKRRLKGGENDQK